MSTPVPLLLKDTKKIELDPRLFAHIHQDHRLLGSHLQGSQFNVTARYVLETLEHFSNNDTSGSITETLMDRTENKATLEKVIAQFQILMSIESEVDVAQKMVQGSYILHWGSEEQFFGKSEKERERERVPLVLLDAQNKPTKLWIYQKGKNRIVEIKDYPEELLVFIAQNKDKKVDQYSHYNNTTLWTGHPVFKWLTSLWQTPLLEKPHVGSLKAFQEKCIEPTAKSIFEKLEIQNNILMPGGWDGSDAGTPGHAMIYQFIKNPDGSYNFIVYNTGAGIKYHKTISKAKDKYVPLMAYNIPADTKPEEIKNFITHLLTPLIAPFLETMYKEVGYGSDPSWEAKKIYNEERVYKEIIQNNIPAGSVKIDNPISAIHSKEAREIFTQGQLSGTCAMRVLMPFLKVNMGADNFREFQYAFDLKSLQDYFETQKQKHDLGQPTNLHNPMVKRQLLQAIRRSVIKTGKLSKRYKQGVDKETVISKEKSEEILSFLMGMENELRTLSKIAQKAKEPEKGMSLDSLSVSQDSHISSDDREIWLLFEGAGSKEIKDIFDDNAKYLISRILADTEYYDSAGNFSMLIKPQIVVLQVKDGFQICYKKRGDTEVNAIIIQNDKENGELFSLLLQQENYLIKKDNQNRAKIYDLVFKIVRQNSGVVDQLNTSLINDSNLKTVVEEKTAAELPVLKAETYVDKPFEYLKDCYEVVSQNDAEGYNEAVLVQIENFFLSFPLSSKAELEAYLKNVSVEQAQEALAYVQHILRIYGKNCGKLNPYPSAAQTITSYTALLIASCVANRLYDNHPTFQKLTAQVLPKEGFLAGINSNSFDPRFDQRLAELYKINSEMRGDKEFECEELDYYDVAFLKYRSLEDKGLADLKGQYNSSTDEQRRHLQEALKGNDKISLSAQTKKDYDNFLQLKQIQYECKGIENAEYNYFNVVTTAVKNNEDAMRLSKLKCNNQSWKLDFTRFTVENEEFLKKDEFLYKFETSNIRENPLTLEKFYKIKNDYIKKMLLKKDIKSSNAVLVEHQEYISKHKPNEYISRILPFTRQESGCSVAITKDFFESNFDLLDKHDWQVVLLANLFSPAILEKQLSNDRFFVKRLQQFLEEASRYYSRDENALSEGAMFVFELQYFLCMRLKIPPVKLRSV